jgi:flagellar hook-associated protein 2
MQSLGSFEGIASGLNTTEIVNAIITAERASARLLESRQTQKTNELSTFSSLEALLLALKTETSRIAKSSTFDVSQSSVSDSTILDVNAPGLVPKATYEIQVRKLAQAHQVASQGFASLSDAVGTGTFTIQVGDGSAKTVTLTAENATLSGLRDAINAADAGVSASIINDGSTTNPYRLVLTGTSTGLKNRITLTNGLSGGAAPDFTTARFDAPEKLLVAFGTSAQLSLGATASYSGNENKTYTFTVKGSGSQTVGVGEITVEWTDGTNSGTVLVSQADTEIALSGTGSDGLKLSFSAGTLTAGDAFQVQTFAPQLQAAQDAEIAVGTSGGGATPLILRGATNTLSGALPGITLALKKTNAAGEKVTVTVGPAVDNVKTRVQDFVGKYNAVISAIDKQFSYDETKQEGGTLLGDSSLLFIQSRLRTRIGSAIPGLVGELKMLAALGIRSDSEGLLKIDDAKLTKMIEENWESVRKLFTNSGGTNKTGISFISATADTKTSESGYDVDITQAATHGYYQGKEISDPAVTALVIASGSNSLKITSDGVTSDTITLSAGTYTSGAQLAAELQTRIDNDEKMKGRGIVVEFVDNGTSGHLTLTSGSYGSTSTVSVAADLAGSAAELLGLSGAASVNGLDVKGTINGEAATGKGQILTGDEDNENTAGLVLKVELASDELLTGVDGRITYTRGIGAALDAELDLLTRTNTGFVNARKKGIQAQINDIKDQIKRIDERLVIRRNALLKQFAAMEEAISQFQNTGTYLTNAVASLSNNFRLSRSNR